MFESTHNSKKETVAEAAGSAAAEGLNSVEILKGMAGKLDDLAGGKGGWSGGHGAFIIGKPKPENACVEDKDGYIACGPIVGYERPETPRIIKPLNQLK